MTPDIHLKRKGWTEEQKGMKTNQGNRLQYQQLHSMVAELIKLDRQAR